MSTRNECAVPPLLLLAPDALFGRCQLLPLWRCAGRFQLGPFFGQPGPGGGFGMVRMGPAGHALLARCAEAPPDQHGVVIRIVGVDAVDSPWEKGLGESAGEILLVHPVAVAVLSVFGFFHVKSLGTLCWNCGA